MSPHRHPLVPLDFLQRRLLAGRSLALLAPPRIMTPCFYSRPPFRSISSSSDDGEEEEEAEAPAPGAAAAAGAGLDETVEDVSKRTKGSEDIVDVGSAFGSLAARVAGQMAAVLRSDAERRAERAAARAAKEKEKRQRKKQEQAAAAAAAAAASAAKMEEQKEQLLVTPEVMQPEAVKGEAAAVEGVISPGKEEEEEELVVAPQQQWASKDNVLITAQLQRLAEQEERELRMKREVEFRQMLDELVDPPVTPLTPWAVVKRRVWSDYRFVAVEPDCRETVFAEYIEVGEGRGYRRPSLSVCLSVSLSVSLCVSLSLSLGVSPSLPRSLVRLQMTRHRTSDAAAMMPSPSRRSSWTTSRPWNLRGATRELPRRMQERPRERTRSRSSPAPTLPHLLAASA